LIEGAIEGEGAMTEGKPKGALFISGLSGEEFERLDEELLRRFPDDYPQTQEEVLEAIQAIGLSPDKYKYLFAHVREEERGEDG
jgi:hypothetical protein